MDSIQNTITGGAFFGTVIQGKYVRVVLPTPVTPALSGLPQDKDAFTGRAVELAALLDRLSSGEAATVVSGLAGVGKTALAVHAAHRALDDFPGGVLFADLQGYDEARRVDPARVLDGWLRALGIPGEHVPPATQDRERLYRSVLNALAAEDRRLLVVIDNVASASDVVPLLPPTGAGCAIITSRHSLGLLDARAVRLSALDEKDGALLLQRALATLTPDDARCEDDPEGARRVAELCGGLPLALRIVAALLADDPGRTLAVLADDLERAGLAGLEYAEATVRAAFDLSFGQLSAEQAAVFTLLPVVPGPDASDETVAVLSGLDVLEARRVLQGLARANLVERNGDRWRMHDLVRLYAAEHTQAPDQALATLMDHYRSSVDAALSHLEPALTPEDRFPTREEALDWLDAERVSLLAAIRTVPPELIQQLSLNIGTYLSLRGLHDDWIEVSQATVDAARALGDRERERSALNHLGIAYSDAGLPEEALDACEQAMAMAENGRDRAAMLANLGAMLRRLGRGEEAIAACREAAEFFETVGDALGLARARGNLGSALRDLGRRDEALALLREVVTDFDRLGGQEDTGIALNNLAHALLDDDRPGEAETHAREAVERHRAAGALWRETEALLTLGLAVHAQGRVREAAEIHERNLELLADFDDVSRAAKVAYHYAEAHAQLGELDEAYDGYYVASNLYERLQDAVWEAATMANIGLIWIRQNKLGDAARMLLLAADGFAGVGADDDEARALALLAPVELSLGHLIDAMETYARAARLHRRRGDRRAEGGTLARLAILQQEDSLYETASETAAEALRVCRETGDRDGERTALNALALALGVLRHHEESIAVNHEHIALCRELDDQRPLADSFVNLAVTLREARRRKESDAALREAVRLYRALGDPAEAERLAKDLTVAGRTRRLLFAAARPLRSRRALFRDLMGQKYLELEMVEEAIRSHERSRPIWRALGERVSEGGSMFFLSRALLANRDYEDAERAADYASRIFRYVGDEQLELVACMVHARACAAALRPRDALAPYERAIELARALRHAETEEMLESEYAEARKAPYLPGAVFMTISSD
ncbi:tetratricopeptide repeat protein [Nonomuraea sp. NPDC050536]|uniref:tetratricopeptide repeat protein n=1 Tax=Nonomuraea sp. NPDC050536 TaxID=3364366 RepID=UPI0037CC8CFC